MQTIITGTPDFIIEVSDSAALLLTESSAKGFMVDPEILENFIVDYEAQHEVADAELLNMIRKANAWSVEEPVAIEDTAKSEPVTEPVTMADPLVIPAKPIGMPSLFDISKK